MNIYHKTFALAGILLASCSQINTSEVSEQTSEILKKQAVESLISEVKSWKHQILISREGSDFNMADENDRNFIFRLTELNRLLNNEVRQSSEIELFASDMYKIFKNTQNDAYALQALYAAELICELRFEKKLLSEAELFTRVDFLSKEHYNDFSLVWDGYKKLPENDKINLRSNIIFYIENEAEVFNKISGFHPEILSSNKQAFNEAISYMAN